MKDKSEKTIQQQNSYTGVWITIGLCFVLFLIAIFSILDTKRARDKSECEKSGKVYVEETGVCREKNTSEKFSEKCVAVKLTFSGKTYTCADLKYLGLEKAYLDDNIVEHDGTLYEGGTPAEIAAGKAAGDYCLNADDTWSHIGEIKCVVFNYRSLACSNGYCFLNEKKDYKTGFVAFFGKYRMYSWESFSATYKDGGPILVCGQIYLYQGHPEIKVTDASRQTVLHPNATKRGNYTVYGYTCGE